MEAVLFENTSLLVIVLASIGLTVLFANFLPRICRYIQSIEDAIHMKTILALCRRKQELLLFLHEYRGKLAPDSFLSVAVHEELGIINQTLKTQ